MADIAENVVVTADTSGAQAAFAQMVSGAEKNCPVSKVLNAAITVDAKLISA